MFGLFVRISFGQVVSKLQKLLSTFSLRYRPTCQFHVPDNAEILILQ
ncbi:unnamed protein product [Brassica rapa subsp. trilocularis]